MKFEEIIQLIVERSGGSMDKIKLEDFMEKINHAFIPDPNYWLGVHTQKAPWDLMTLQEIIFEKRPDTIIECGTAEGGSAYFMATLMDLIHLDLALIHGKVITIDKVLHKGRPLHPRIDYCHSDCLFVHFPPETLGERVMLILDCNHDGKHVYEELEKFSKLVSAGQYIIVEDTDAPDRVNGPAEAISKFLKTHPNFVIDRSREKYGVSSNLGGYLLKIS